MSIRVSSKNASDASEGAEEVAVFIGESEYRTKRLLARRPRGSCRRRLVLSEFSGAPSTAGPTDLAQEHVFCFTMARAASAWLTEGAMHG